MDSGFLEIAFKMMVALGAVLLTFGGSVMAARKLSNMRGGNKTKKLIHALEVLHSKSMGPGRSVVTLKAGTKTILIGVTNQNISFLTELADEGEEMDDFGDALNEKSESGIGSKIQSDLANRIREITRV